VPGLAYDPGVLAPCPASREHTDPRSAEPGTLTRPPRPPCSPDALSLTGELVGRTRLRQLFGAPFAVGADPLMAAPFAGTRRELAAGSSTSAEPLLLDVEPEQRKDGDRHDGRYAQTTLRLRVILTVTILPLLTR
jgi:hypothetical protein